MQKAIDQNGSAANYHVELAKVLMKEGGDAQAEASLRKALSLVPNSPKLLAMLGQVLYRQKKVDEARDTLERAAADTKTRNPEARYLLGKIYRDDKDFDRAIRLFEKAAQEYTSDPLMAATAYNAEGQALEAKGEKDKARVAYEKALNAEKEYDEPYCNYARLLSKSAMRRTRTASRGPRPST